MEHISKISQKVIDELWQKIKDKGPTVTITSVKHDDWCNLLNQKNDCECNCNPDIENIHQS